MFIKHCNVTLLLSSAKQFTNWGVRPIRSNESSIRQFALDDFKKPIKLSEITWPLHYVYRSFEKSRTATPVLNALFRPSLRQHWMTCRHTVLHHLWHKPAHNDNSSGIHYERQSSSQHIAHFRSNSFLPAKLCKPHAAQQSAGGHRGGVRCHRYGARGSTGG